MDNQSYRMIYISRCYRNLTSAGNKAKTDNETTMQDMGFTNVGLPQRVSHNGIFIFLYDLAGIIKACLSIRKGDILVLQYPVKKYFSFLCNITHLHGGKVIALIHDLGSFRRRKLTIRKEISRLSHADCVIASNKAMEQWLKDNGLKTATCSLGLFDYRSPSSARRINETKSDEYNIVYAGSLAMRKNAFFLLMPTIIKGYKLHIYGNGEAMPSLKEDKHFIFHGFTPADEFIAHAGGDFGLVWDGDSLDACTGSFGGYLRYNSPHKASFYLRAGMPVIVWRDAAIAKTVEQEGIGFTINSLRELPDKLAKTTSEDIAVMRQNAVRMAEKLDNGDFFKKAIAHAVTNLVQK